MEVYMVVSSEWVKNVYIFFFCFFSFILSCISLFYFLSFSFFLFYSFLVLAFSIFFLSFSVWLLL